MRYAGFWQRFCAAIIDVLLFLPLSIGLHFAIGGAKSAELAAMVTTSVVWSAYIIVLTALRGQTVGKIAMNIRVARVDGGPVGWQESILRHGVDLVLAGFSIYAYVLAYGRIPDDEFARADFLGRAELVDKAMGSEGRVMVWAGGIWAWSELITMLCNQRRRALHDFIAGTVVIRLR